MGCDIHLFTERKRTINDKERWVNIDYWKRNPYFGDPYETREYDCVSLYRERNYNLFGILAGVRGLSGPICPPKGLPEDISMEVKKESDIWDGDGHSHSYFTLKELKDNRARFKMQKYAGKMSLADGIKVDNREMPEVWWAYSSIPESQQVYKEWEYPSDHLGKLIDAIEERKKEEFWIFDEKEHPEFDDQIRVVFWFDN